MNNREKFEVWCRTTPLGAELDNVDMLPSNALEAAWVGYDAATKASDARYQARIKQLEGYLYQLKSIIPDGFVVAQNTIAEAPPFVMSKYASKEALLTDKCAWQEQRIAELERIIAENAKQIDEGTKQNKELWLMLAKES